MRIHHLLPKNSVIYKHSISCDGNSHHPTFSVQVPLKLHNTKKVGKWIFKKNVNQVWIGTNGRLFLTHEDWMKIKSSVERGFMELKEYQNER